MSAYELILLVSCVASAMFATSILARDPTEPTNRLSSAIVMGGAFWAFCQILWNETSDPDTALALIKLSALGWVAIGPLALNLMLELAGHRTAATNKLLGALYASSFTLVLLDWTTPWVHERVVKTSWGWSYELGPLYPLFYLITIGAIISGMVLVGHRLRNWPSLGERNQARGLLIGISIPLTVGSVTDGILPFFGIHVWHLGTASIATLGATVSWTFYRYGYSLLAPGTFAREILETMPDGLAFLHLDGRIRRTNPVLCKMAGATRASELMGVHISKLLADCEINPADSLQEAETSFTTLQGGPPKPVAVSTRPLIDRLEFPTGVVLVIRDLREVVALRQRVLIGGRMAAVGQLAAGVAHELNNPIAYVRANLSMLEKHWAQLRSSTRPKNANADLDLEWIEGGELIDESLEGIERATSIVREIMTFSHAGSSEREEVDVKRLLDATIRIASAQLRDRAEMVRENGQVPMLKCAPREIQQVFLNLLLNAVDASPKATEGERPIIRIETNSSEGELFIRFIDEGEGIPPEALERIFDPFFTTKPAGEGTGLGLALSYEIVRRHGGEISVTTQIDKGSCFTVSLPLETRDDASHVEN